MSPNLAYLKSRVNSATPVGLIVLLYEGMIRFASDAREMLSQTEPSIPDAANAVRRSIDILTGLNSSLRYEAAPELCDRLSGLYAFFTEEMHLALQGREPERITKILPLMEELLTAWREAEMQVTSTGESSQPPTGQSS